MAWSPDGRHVYFTKQGQLWRVTPDGKQVEQVQALPGRGAGPFSFSPDGRRVAFTLAESKSELWALENLATPVKPR